MVCKRLRRLPRSLLRRSNGDGAKAGANATRHFLPKRDVTPSIAFLEGGYRPVTGMTRLPSYRPPARRARSSQAPGIAGGQ